MQLFSKQTGEQRLEFSIIGRWKTAFTPQVLVLVLVRVRREHQMKTSLSWKKKLRSPFFEINSDPFYYPSDNNEDRENKLDSESKVQERAAEDVSVESRPVQAF